MRFLENKKNLISRWLLEASGKFFPPRPQFYSRLPRNRSGFKESYSTDLKDFDSYFPATGSCSQTYKGSQEKTTRPGKIATADGYLGSSADGDAQLDSYFQLERLHQRLLIGGQVNMFEDELLELLLSKAMPMTKVKPLAKRLLLTFGDLNGIIAAKKHRLLKVEGVTDEVWLQLRIAEAVAHRMGQSKVINRSALTNWGDLIDYCRTTMAHRDTEMFRILFLDARNVVIADEEQARGTIDHVPVYPREVAKRALELSAASMILVHNHPSGNVAPSRADIAITTDIARACGTIDVDLYDHVIIGKGDEVSFRSEGLL